MTMVVIGGLNMDLAVRVPRLPAPGQTVTGSEALRSPGGKGGNQAVAAARLGARARMIGMVGDDPFGAELRRNLIAEGVDVAGVGTASGTATGMALIVVQADGENTITLSPGANAVPPPIEVGVADVLLMNLEIPLGASGAVAASDEITCVEKGFPTEAIDTVGAGDAFCAALAVALGSGVPLATALRRACAAGALATTRPGAQSALPTNAEINQLLSR